MVAVDTRADVMVVPGGSSTRRSAFQLALRHYTRELVRQWPIAVPGLLAPAAGNICGYYLAPLVVAGLVGRLAGGGELDLATTSSYVLGFGALLLLGEAFWRLGFHLLNRVDGRGIATLYTAGMDELLAKDAAFFHDNFAGSLTKRTLSYASRFEEFVDTLAFAVIGDVVPLAFACVVLWRYDPMLVVVLLGSIVLTGLLIAPLVRRRQAIVDEREVASARMSGHVADVLGNMESVHAFAAWDREAAEHRRRVDRLSGLFIRSWDYNNLRIDTIVAPMLVLANTLGLLLAIGHGRLGVEAVVVTFTYFMSATKIMFEFNQIYRRLESSLTEAAQFTELLLHPPTVLDPARPEPLLVPPAADVRFERVQFAHAGGRTLFSGLDLTVPSGTKVGFVGRSGGGKTTLTRLLLRLMDLDGGRILIGGQDIARLRQADLRSLIAYVPQDPAMFHRSLRDNIAFGRPEATDAEIQRAAQAAHVTEFARELPDGFDTLVGERGVKLSGGQRQRVAIARAVLRDAPILLLDEATSALDSESELLIQQALWQLMSGRTALVVAHRLSTVARMDRLVVLDGGRIVEQGSHAELLERRGTYSGLWRHQSGGFLDGETEPIPRPDPTRPDPTRRGPHRPVRAAMASRSETLEDGGVGQAAGLAHRLQGVAGARRRASAWTSVVIRRAPLAPSGWPRAIAPPLTLTLAGSAPVSACQASTTLAKASLTSNRSMSSRRRPARRSTLSVAGMTPVSIISGSSPDTAKRVQPGLRGEAQLARPVSLVVISSAALPSLTGLALPAVTRQPICGNRALHSSLAKAGRRPASTSGVVLRADALVPVHDDRRTVGPVTGNGAISPVNRPAAVAAAARWWLAAANSSSRARSRSHLAAISSALMPCGTRPSG